MAAPIFCFIYRLGFKEYSADVLWLYFDIKALFFLIFFYPVVEELVFRGIIQEYLHKKTKQLPFLFSFSIANLTTSVLFVLMHLVNHTTFFAL